MVCHRTGGILSVGLWICFVFLLSTSCTTTDVQKAKETTKTAPSAESSVSPEAAEKTTAVKETKRPEEQVEQEEKPAPEEERPEIVLSKGQERFVMSELWSGIIRQQNGDQEEARYHYRRILDILPDSAHVLALMARSYLETNQLERALQSAQKAVKAAPTTPSAYDVLGQVYARQEEWDQAAQQYERMLEYAPHSVQALQQLAQMRARAGDVDEAVECYERLIRTDPGRSGLYHFHMATILESANRYAEAIDAYRQLIEEYPDHFDIYMRVAQLHRRIGEQDKAIAVYLRALELGPNPHTEVAIRTELAQLYQQRGSRADAYAQYARIQELSKDNVEALTYMTLLLIQDEEYDKALSTVNKLLSVRPRDPNTVLLKCRILVLKREWQESADLFLKSMSKAIAMMDRDVSSRLHVDQYTDEVLKPSTRQIFLQSGKAEELIALLRRADEEIDDPALSLAIRVLRFEMEDDPTELVEHIEGILLEWDSAVSQGERETYELYLATLQDAGVLNRMMEGPNATILGAILRKATKKFEDDAASPLLLSFIQFRNKEWNDAEVTLQHVLDRTEPEDQRHQMALERLALVYEKLERIGDAERVLRRLIELDPESAEAYNMLGYLFAENNLNLPEAETLIKKALEITPDNENIMDSLGWVYYRQGDYEKALELLTKAQQKSQEDHPVILDHLGDAYNAVGQTDRAVEMWRKALQVGPNYPFDFTPEMRENIEQKINETQRPVTP